MVASYCCMLRPRGGDRLGRREGGRIENSEKSEEDGSESEHPVPLLWVDQSVSNTNPATGVCNGTTVQ
jgi:hypothetical protein